MDPNQRNFNPQSIGFGFLEQTQPNTTPNNLASNVLTNKYINNGGNNQVPSQKPVGLGFTNEMQHNSYPNQPPYQQPPPFNQQQYNPNQPPYQSNFQQPPQFNSPYQNPTQPSNQANYQQPYQPPNQANYQQPYQPPIQQSYQYPNQQPSHLPPNQQTNYQQNNYNNSQGANINWNINDFLMSIFRQIDMDNSNFISASELSTALSKAQQNFNFDNQTIEFILRRFDTDNSRNISFNEFKNLYMYLNDEYATFLCCDVDSDGCINANEMANGLANRGIRVNPQCIQFIINRIQEIMQKRITFDVFCRVNSRFDYLCQNYSRIQHRPGDSMEQYLTQTFFSEF